MYNALEKYTRDKPYIRLSEKTNEKKYLVDGNNSFISRRMGDRDGLFTSKGRSPEGKNTL